MINPPPPLRGDVLAVLGDDDGRDSNRYGDGLRLMSCRLKLRGSVSLSSVSDDSVVSKSLYRSSQHRSRTRVDAILLHTHRMSHASAMSHPRETYEKRSLAIRLGLRSWGDAVIERSSRTRMELRNADDRVNGAKTLFSSNNTPTGDANSSSSSSSSNNNKRR